MLGTVRKLRGRSRLRLPRPQTWPKQTEWHERCGMALSRTTPPPSSAAPGQRRPPSSCGRSKKRRQSARLSRRFVAIEVKQRRGAVLSGQGCSLASSSFFSQEALALDLAHLEQRNRALEAAGEAKRAAAAEAQRALRAQLAEANGAARQRAEAEREKDRAADATALAFVVAKQREEVARQQAADAARRERDRAFAAMLQTSQRAASSAVR